MMMKKKKVMMMMMMQGWYKKISRGKVVAGASGPGVGCTSVFVCSDRGSSGVTRW